MTIEERAAEWIRGWDTGISSKQVWKVMTGHFLHDEDPSNYGQVPWDPDDFGRCHRLLELIPEWRSQLHRVATAYPKWAPLIREWDALTKMFVEALPLPEGRQGRDTWALYERMQELQIESGARGGPVFRRSDQKKRWDAGAAVRAARSGR